MVAELIGRWQDRTPRALESCAYQGEDAGVRIVVEVSDSSAIAVDAARSLVLHGESINRGSYAVAWSLFTPLMQGALEGLDDWSDGLASSYWERLTVDRVTATSSAATAVVRLRTTQAPDFGRQRQTCSDWRITYRMVRSNGVWLSDRATGSNPTAC